MGRRAGRRDRRAQARGAVEALVRAGWSAGEVQQLLDLARTEGRDPEQVAVGLLVAELRRSLGGPGWEEDPDDDEECGPHCELCAPWDTQDDGECGPWAAGGPREADGWTRWC